MPSNARRAVADAAAEREDRTSSEVPAAVGPVPVALPRAAGARLFEIDVLRGLVIVLMALDHVRDYFHVDAFDFDPLDPARTTLPLYATRWITHLCAPTFVFLAGASAHLQLARGKSAADLSRFLWTRGLWLILLEGTVLSFGWSFSFPYPPFLQVIWAIGWSMIALAALVLWPPVAVLAVGVAIVASHNLLDPIAPEQLGVAAPLWTLLHEGGPLSFDGAPFGLAAYPILPWIGVVGLGYGLGPVFLAAPARRDASLATIGLAMLAVFAMLRAFGLYGDPRPWDAEAGGWASAMSFLDVTKYPPSLQFVLMTLGVVLVLWPLVRRMPSAWAKGLAVFGAVPLFFYVLHVYVVHGAAILANAAAGRDPSGLFGYLANTFLAPERVATLGFPLPTVYLATLVVLALLFPLCRRWRDVKRTRREWWLSYL
jgi:uncharacterized membrane protein